jgi:geranylgeranyl diphosphate synthase type II
MTKVQENLADFKAQLAEKARMAETILAELLDQQTDIPQQLRAAIYYTVKAPGKRLRASLVLWCSELLAGWINENAKFSAAAVEMVHTYSLVHDDLPAMDDDDFRRGRPSCHKAFDEATAILTGDALLSLAFETLATRIDNPQTAVRLIAELATAAGPAGMIAGQIQDLQAQNTKGSEQLLECIHTNKTARMFRCAAAMGAICGKANKQQYNQLCEYGLKLGLGFQIADDILDVSASSEHLGKTVGKDVRQGKVTYPAIAGLARSRELGKKLAAQAAAALDGFGVEAEVLRILAVELEKRTR